MVLATTLREDGGPDDEEWDPTDTGSNRLLSGVGLCDSKDLSSFVDVQM